MDAQAFNAVLGPVAARFSDAADAILDLRAAVLNERNAGQCLQCFFRIYGTGVARRQHASDLAPLIPLKQWVEENIDIVAREPSKNELERLPVSIRDEDLESFCHRVMRQFHEDRSYASRAIELSLDFKDTRSTTAA